MDKLETNNQLILFNKYKSIFHLLGSELPHLKERNHDKAFYQLCQYMEPGYHQLEFDCRVYLLWKNEK